MIGLLVGGLAWGTARLRRTRPLGRLIVAAWALVAGVGAGTLLFMWAFTGHVFANPNLAAPWLGGGLTLPLVALAWTRFRRATVAVAAAALVVCGLGGAGAARPVRRAGELGADPAYAPRPRRRVRRRPLPAPSPCRAGRIDAMTLPLLAAALLALAQAAVPAQITPPTSDAPPPIPADQRQQIKPPPAPARVPARRDVPPRPRRRATGYRDPPPAARQPPTRWTGRRPSRQSSGASARRGPT